MKIVINQCFGGFGLSPRAIKRLAELRGKDCYFFLSKYSRKSGNEYTPISLEELEKKNPMFWVAFDIPEASSKSYEKHALSDGDCERNDPLLIQVVEELGEKANGMCARLNIVDIPDGISWEISEYDGNEHVAESHRTWC